jgi:hypothetical protein
MKNYEKKTNLLKTVISSYIIHYTSKDYNVLDPNLLLKKTPPMNKRNCNYAFVIILINNTSKV